MSKKRCVEAREETWTHTKAFGYDETEYSSGRTREDLAGNHYIVAAGVRSKNHPRPTGDNAGRRNHLPGTTSAHTGASTTVLRSRKLTSSLLVLALLLGCGVPLALSDMIPTLFSDTLLPSSTDLSAAHADVLQQAAMREAQDPTIIRSRHVRINFKALQTDGPVRLNLFRNVVLTVTKDRTEIRSPDRYTLYGHVEGQKNSSVLLVVEKDLLVGNISVHDRGYQVRSIGQGLHSVREINQAAFPEEAPPIPVPGSVD